MIDNNNLLKMFVLVPDTITNFDGTQSSLANSGKIYFDVYHKAIWAKGEKYGFTDDEINLINTILGTDKATGNETQKSIREIAQDVVNNIASWQGADANDIIDTLKEVLAWFNNLPEGDAGALALINAVGKPASGTPGQEGYTAATGLYKLIEDSVAAKNVEADGKAGEDLIDASAANNKVEIFSTQKLKDSAEAARSSLQNITIAGVAITKSEADYSYTGEITKESLQGALFTNNYTDNTPLSYSYLGISVSIKETDGEVHDLVIDPTTLANRVSKLENYDPWETYSAS